MPKDAVFTLKIEPELREAFMAEAAASHRPASQIMREMMRSFVEKQKAEREHDAWFRARVEQAIAIADSPDAKWLPHEEVKANMARQRDILLARLKTEK